MTSSDRWDDRYATSDFLWTDTVNQFVERELGGLEPGSAIDLGAGEGRNAVWLASQGWAVTAVDFSDVGLDKARRLAEQRGVALNFVAADVLTYVPKDKVDLVVLSYLQLPDAQQRQVLERAATWVKSGGTLLVVAHDKTNVTDGHGGPPTPDVCYSVDQTTAALGGLEIERAEVVERVVETPEGPKTALDTLVVARSPGEAGP